MLQLTAKAKDAKAKASLALIEVKRAELIATGQMTEAKRLELGAATKTEGYGVSFEWEQYELTAKKLKAIKGKAVVSINDHPAIRECFQGYDMEALTLDYTVGGGAKRVERGELVIYNWDRQAEPAGLF